MKIIAHISDLHFGTEVPVVVEALLQDLSKVKPDLLIASGDITQRGRSKEFQKADQFFNKIPAARLVIPGNHDISLFNPYRRFFKTHHRFNRYITGGMFPRYIDDEIAVFGLNTASIFKWKAGLISKEQLNYIEDLCSSVQSKHKALVTHHPFIVDTGQKSNIVGRASKAMKSIEKSGIDMIFTGHLHMASFYNARHFYDEIDKTLIVSQAGTAISKRSRKEPNTYNLLILDGNKLEIRSKVYIQERFMPRQEINYEKVNGIWELVKADKCLI